MNKEDKAVEKLADKDLNHIIEQLTTRQYRLPLQPAAVWNKQVQAQIKQLHGLHTNTAGITVIAALHLLNDDLDLSHSYAQQIEHDPTGAYWHGIMHRMESDYPNAKYWFRQATPHPAIKQIAPLVAQLCQNTDFSTWKFVEKNAAIQQILSQYKVGNFTSATFTDIVQITNHQQIGDATWLTFTQHIQAIELEQLFRYSLAQQTT